MKVSGLHPSENLSQTFTWKSQKTIERVILLQAALLQVFRSVDANLFLLGPVITSYVDVNMSGQLLT